MNMKGKGLYAIAAVAMCTVCIEAPAAKKTFSPGDNLAQIVNHTSADIQYVIGEGNVEIIGSEAALRNIHASVSNRSLRVRYADNHNSVSSDVIIRVYSENVGNFITYGSGDIKADRIEAVSVSLQSFGSGDITVGTVECTGLQIGIYGAGDITVDKSESSTVKTIVQGAGDITVRHVEAASIEATMQGAGDIFMPSIDGASVRVINHGVGDITLGGEVSTAVLTGQGVGDINARNLKAVKTTKIKQGLGDIHN